MWLDKSDDAAYMKDLVAQGTDLTIVGIVQPKADSSAAMLSSGIGYTQDLTDYVIQQAKASPMVQQQMADPQTNVFTGEVFGSDSGTTLDMASLFSVDTDALQNAFQLDTSGLRFDLSGAFDLSGGSLDLSTLLDPDSFTLDLSGLPELDVDLSTVFADLDLTLSPQALQTLMQKLLKGYKDYVVGNGILHLDKIGFESYLQSQQFRQLLASSLQELLADADLQQQFSSALQKALGTVMEAYSAQISQAMEAQLGTVLASAMSSWAAR